MSYESYWGRTEARAGREKGPSSEAAGPKRLAARAAEEKEEEEEEENGEEESVSLVRVDTAKPIPVGATTLRMDSGLPPVLTAISFEPPLPADVRAHLRLNSISVAVEDMLAVPDWTEPKSFAGRVIWDAMKTAGVEEPFVDHSRYDVVALVLSKAVPRGTVVRSYGVNVIKRKDGDECLIFSM
jgi:hypothetical protein